jgi:hypothetical protein
VAGAFLFVTVMAAPISDIHAFNIIMYRLDASISQIKITFAEKTGQYQKQMP